MAAIQNISPGLVHTALDTELVSASKGNSAYANGQGGFDSLDVSKAVDKMIQNTVVKSSGNHSLNLMSKEDEERIQNGQRPLGRPDVPPTAQKPLPDLSALDDIFKEISDKQTGHATIVDGAGAREAGVV